MKIDELKLTKSVADAAREMGPDEARYMVDTYYQIQEFRIAAQNQHRSLVQSEKEKPNELTAWVAAGMEYFESQIRRALDRYSDSTDMGRWAKAIIGVGPVIAAGLDAHIDIERAPTVGHVWKYAGLAPGQRRKRGERLDYNPALKVLCWKIGESFVKVSGNPNALYGQFYLQRKAYETEKNERGEYAEQAKQALEVRKIGKDTDAYKAYSVGQLPKGHIHARAKRWAVKLFLAHWHEAAYRARYGTEPPMPYPIAHLGHAHKISAA